MGQSTMSRFPFFLVTQYPVTSLSAFVAAPILSATTYAIYYHHKISLRVHHESIKTPISLKKSLPITETFTSIPSSEFTTPHVALHDLASLTVHLPSLSRNYLTENNGNEEDLITRYLRHTMKLFASRLPQGYILRLVVPREARRTFQHEYIKNLKFQKGDVVCGIFRVAVNTSTKVEFEMMPVPGTGNVLKGGRMAVFITPESGCGENLIISTETITWKKEGEKGLLPLETMVGRWMHELAAWGLLDSGSRFLIDMDSKMAKSA